MKKLRQHGKEVNIWALEQNLKEVCNLDSNYYCIGELKMANYLFRLTLVYGGNRNNIIVVEKNNVVASSVEEAKIKSGIMKEINSSWDTDFITLLAEKVGEVLVKEKTKKVIIEKESE